MVYRYSIQYITYMYGIIKLTNILCRTVSMTYISYNILHTVLYFNFDTFCSVNSSVSTILLIQCNIQKRMHRK